MIVEINTANFLFKMTQKYKGKVENINNLLKIDEIPDEEWEKLKYNGMTKYIWLMGVWKRSKLSKIISIKNFQEFIHIVRDLKEDDIIGSAYSIVDYSVDPLIGDFKSLIKVKNKLNRLGIGLILDFIPNHFSLDNNYINEDIFIETDFNGYKKNPYLFYVTENEGKIRYIAHGKDPFFPPWIDTLQINIFSKKAQKILLKNLKKISKYADGVRVDMSMLLLNNIFYNNWKDYIKLENIEEEFWSIATKSVDLTFIAECYWNLENKMLKLGFHYTYDKKFLDNLFNINDIKQMISMDFEFQKKMVRFLENHDEERIANKIENKDEHILTLFFTCLGMKMIYWEQFEGQTTRIPVQLIRANDNYKSLPFYQKIIEIYPTIKNFLEEGKFFIFKVENIYDDTSKNLIAYGYLLNEKVMIVVMNFSSQFSQGIISIKNILPQSLIKYLQKEEKDVVLVELIKGERYYRNLERVHVVLNPFQAQIFIEL